MTEAKKLRNLSINNAMLDGSVDEVKRLLDWYIQLTSKPKKPSTAFILDRLLVELKDLIELKIKHQHIKDIDISVPKPMFVIRRTREYRRRFEREIEICLNFKKEFDQKERNRIIVELLERFNESC